VRIDQRLDAGTYVERSAPAQDLTAA
jgi:hypothetical protein